MIRVLHVTAGMSRGGIETFIMNIYRNIEREKVQFDFLVHTEKECDYHEEIRKMGGRIFFIPPRNRGVLKNRNALNEFFKNHNEYKIIHQHVSSLTYVAPLKIAKKFDVPVRIVHSHNTKQSGSRVHKYIHKYNQLFVKLYATHYLACSDFAAKWLYLKKQYERNDFKIINNAIETDKFIFNEAKRYIKRKELRVEDKFVLGHIGRFTHQKNHELLIDIFKTVHDKKKDSVLLLVGDGNLRQSIEEKVNKLNLTSNVIFTGVRSDISELLLAMDVFVMPSYHEGLPVTVVEAQASGLPCVLSKNITREVEILECVKWCDLSDELSIWAKNILYFVENNARSNTKQKIVSAGFDIKNLAYDIQKMYIESINCK